MGAADIIRGMLLVVVILLSLMAFLYLGRRRMIWPAYLVWGLVAVVLPVLGPILVIALRPGEPLGRRHT